MTSDCAASVGGLSKLLLTSAGLEYQPLPSCSKDVLDTNLQAKFYLYKEEGQRVARRGRPSSAFSRSPTRARAARPG
jgi:hypothetical protein